MTPRELIAMLAVWDLDEELEVAMMTKPRDFKLGRTKTTGSSDHVVILRQGLDSINLG